MNTIELFEFPDFKGENCVVDKDTADLSEKGFSKKASSLRVRGEPWITYKEDNYKGNFNCYKEGNYNSIPASDNDICSVRHVKGGLYNPEITVFEHIHYGGKTLNLKKAADSLKSYKFDNMVSSHKVVRGAWILYSEEYYKGEEMIALAGDEVPDYRTLGWNDKPSSLKPVEPLYALSVRPGAAVP